MKKDRWLMASGIAMLMACQNETKDTGFRFDEMTYSPNETVFRLFAPTDATCFVVVDEDSVTMNLGADSIWTATLQGDHKGKTYQFVVNGQASPGTFAKAVTVNGQKGVIVDMRDTNPEGWEADEHVLRPYQDIVVYELHHRDFSIARPDAQHPGKFLALTEPWAIQHLQQLGINAVHLLPSYDFGSIDETRLDQAQYNWGYDPVNYNVPEGSYSTDPYDPLCRIREFKQMVQALHKAGIAVILDVVYNHTYDIEHSNFQRTYADYYFRKDPPHALPCREGADTPKNNNDEPSDVTSPSLQGRAGGGSVYSNGSGCGNETASECPMMRRFMTESVRYWIQEYHIDGFRFDLMGVHDIETMNHIRKAVDEINPLIFIYGEGWSAGQCALPTEQLGIKANIHQMPRIAAFCDDMRDALRGPFNDDTQAAFLDAQPNHEESIKFGIVGAIAHPQIDLSKVNYSDKAWATEPTQMMAYVSCHDDMCLVDRLNASIKGQGAKGKEQLIRLDLLAQTAVMTSQGVPFMLSGEELLRTKKGVHNSYESPDSINQLDWDNLQRYPEVFDYYRKLIALRQHHPAFRLGRADLVCQHLEFLNSPAQTVAFRLKDNAGGDEWNDIIVVLNANREEVEVNIPDFTYSVVCFDGKINEDGIGSTVSNKVIVAQQSATIIHN